MRKTKIVATIGPKTCSPKSIRSLKESGMDVARLNGSHADFAWHANSIKTLRETVPEMPILFDIPGRKVRVAILSENIKINVGDTIIFTSDFNSKDLQKVPVTYAHLHEKLSPKDILLVDDGNLRFIVKAVKGIDIICSAEISGTLRSGKGINIPNKCLEIPQITDLDFQMIKFAKENEVDFIGFSFVESSKQVLKIRSLIGKKFPFIVSKIESQKGLDNFDEILEITDVLMIDRGDLSVEIGFESVPLFQNKILHKARKAGKPVIVATEMLHSMIQKPTPTKAEVTDISNAVLNGATATMLSGETAFGNHPNAAVKTMRSIADATSKHLQEVLDADAATFSDVPQAVEDAIALICRLLPVTKIVVVTATGYAARTLSARNPRQPIIAISNSPGVARALNLLQGTEGIFLDVTFSNKNIDHFFC